MYVDKKKSLLHGKVFRIWMELLIMPMTFVVKLEVGLIVGCFYLLRSS